MNKIFQILKQLQSNILCKSVYVNKQEYDCLHKLIKKKKINYVVDVYKQHDDLFFIYFEKFKN